MKVQDTPTINFDAIPEYVKEDLASATLSAVKSFIAMPGGKEFLDTKIKEKQLKNSIG